MTMKLWTTTTALVATALLAGCGIPDLRDRGGRQGGAPWGGGAPVAPAPGPATPAPSLAEQECMAAGRAAGFDVQGVVGTREVMGEGVAVSRDVMLRVLRGGQTLEVRCSYPYDGSAARIMTL